jgi:hypothetical protein
VTGYNDLPGMVRNLSENVGHSILVDTHLAYGRSLYEISESDAVKTKITSNSWDFIILQGTNIRIAYPDNFHVLVPWVDSHPLLPTLEKFRDIAKDNYLETRIVFFMPWAFKDGMLWIQGQTDDFFSMQEKIYANSFVFATELNLEIAPVGWAWYKVLSERNNIELFDQDLSHPSVAGSYLAACVFHSFLLRGVITGNDYYDSIPKEVAKYLQNIASSTVMDNLVLWLNLLKEDEEECCMGLELKQNFPNPFNLHTTIKYGLSVNSRISIDIFDLKGELISTLLDKIQTQGWHTVLWNGINHHGEHAPTGLYLVRIKSDNERKTKKLLLLK